MCARSALVDVVEERHVCRVVEAAGLEPVGEQLFRLGHAALGERHGLVLLVFDVIAGLFELFAVLRLDVALRDRARRQLWNDPVDLVIEIG